MVEKPCRVVCSLLSCQKRKANLLSVHQVPDAKLRLQLLTCEGGQLGATGHRLAHLVAVHVQTKRIQPGANSVSVPPKTTITIHICRPQRRAYFSKGMSDSKGAEPFCSSQPKASLLPADALKKKVLRQKGMNDILFTGIAPSPNNLQSSFLPVGCGQNWIFSFCSGSSSTLSAWWQLVRQLCPGQPCLHLFLALPHPFARLAFLLVRFLTFETGPRRPWSLGLVVTA